MFGISVWFQASDGEAFFFLIEVQQSGILRISPASMSQHISLSRIASAEWQPYSFEEGYFVCDVIYNDRAITYRRTSSFGLIYFFLCNQDEVLLTY